MVDPPAAVAIDRSLSCALLHAVIIRTSPLLEIDALYRNDVSCCAAGMAWVKPSGKIVGIAAKHVAAAAQRESLRWRL
jgi:hypothetical protein